MEKKILSPKNDLIFRKIFGENMKILSGFLQSVLDLPNEEYQGLEVVDPYLEREYIDDKLGILDIKIHTSTRKVIDVEIQIRLQRSIWKRLLFYIAKLLLEQIKKGKRYDQINRVITIYIADHILIKENEAYHNRFRLYDLNTKTYYPDSIEIHTLELPKVRESDKSQLSNWLRFLSAKDEKEFEMLAQTHPAIAEAWGVVKVLSGDERARALAEAREKARMDYEDNYDGAYQEGLQEGKLEGLQEGKLEGLQEGKLEGKLEGLQEGRLEGKLEVAQNLLQEKLPIELVVKSTGLSFEEVKQLASSLAV
jgi:predicted transposase/invertase (TIGR01784 family)